jgi:hypothetical protein
MFQQERTLRDEVVVDLRPVLAIRWPAAGGFGDI